MENDIDELKSVAARIRGKLVEMSHKTGAAHLGSALSCVDILVAAYWGVLKVNPDNPSDRFRDRHILSKGHAAATLYAVLSYRGFFSRELLDTFAESDSCLAEHPVPNSIPGLELATGSLGHGLSVGLGMALAGRIQQTPYRVYVTMSDGECNEGSVWEAALFGPAHRLENVAVIIDYNKWQATGRSNEIMALTPLRNKWESFGWSACEVDGHDMGTLITAMKNVPDGTGRPVAIVAHTVKGKGISFMEDDNNWHYRIPNKDELERARKELKLA
jgi:transketolase